MAVRDEVPLDKCDVSYYSFHIYLGFTAGGAAAPGERVEWGNEEAQ